MHSNSQLECALGSIITDADDIVDDVGRKLLGDTVAITPVLSKIGRLKATLSFVEEALYNGGFPESGSTRNT